MATQIVTLADVKATAGVVDTNSDAWLTSVIDSVGDALETVTGRFLWPRGTATYYFDGSDNPWGFDVLIGVQSVSALGLAWTDQPDDGSGSYTQVPASGYYLDPPPQLRQPGSPATRITLGSRAGVAFPTSGKRTIRVTGSWGPAATPPRIAQIATAAIVRAFRARESGGVDYAVVGPNGGMRILRDVAPAELEELYANYSIAGGILG